jgi:hypothetical protein
MTSQWQTTTTTAADAASAPNPTVIVNTSKPEELCEVLLTKHN